MHLIVALLYGRDPTGNIQLENNTHRTRLPTTMPSSDTEHEPVRVDQHRPENTATTYSGNLRVGTGTLHWIILETGRRRGT